MPTPLISPTESKMWETTKPEPERILTDEEINKKYGKRELRIVTEMNREQLPNFVEALKRPNWMELRPFYQRRQRWNDERQSKLIESFIMNIPVPPLFVYESDFAKYEVMDGQQRITSIKEFYSDTTVVSMEVDRRRCETCDLAEGQEIGLELDRRVKEGIKLIRLSPTAAPRIPPIDIPVYTASDYEI